MERVGNDAAVAAAADMQLTTLSSSSSTPVLPRALASYVVPSSSSGILWPSMLRPGVTRPTRSRSLSAGSQLRARWSASVPPPLRARDQSERSVAHYEDEEGGEILDADAALDALEADARAWKGFDSDLSLSSSLLMLPRELMRSLLVEEAGCSSLSGGRMAAATAAAAPLSLASQTPTPSRPFLPPPPPVAAARCRHGRTDFLCLRPAGSIGEEAEVVVFRFARRKRRSGGEGRREKKKEREDDDDGGGDDDNDSAGSWPSDGASSSSEDEESGPEGEESSEDEDEEEQQVPTCLQTLRLPGPGLPLSRAAAAVAAAASSPCSSDGPSPPIAFFAVAASHWLSLHALGLNEPEYYGAAGRTWGSCAGAGAFGEGEGEDGGEGRTAALALQAAERVSAVALSSSSSSPSSPSSSSSSSADSVHLSFVTERGGAIYEALPFAKGAAAAALPPFPSSSRCSPFRPLAARLVAAPSSASHPLSCGCASTPWSPPCPHSHLAWMTNRPHSLLSAEGRRVSPVDLRARPGSARAATAASLLPAGGLATALCCSSSSSSHLFAVATDARDVLLFDSRRPAAPLASWRLRGSGGGGGGDPITTLSLSLSPPAASPSASSARGGSVLAVDSRGSVTCCAFERGARASRLRPDGEGGIICVPTGASESGSGRKRGAAASPSFSWRALSAATTTAAPPREMTELLPKGRREGTDARLSRRSCGSAAAVAGGASSSPPRPSTLLFRCEGGGGGRSRASLLVDSLSSSYSPAPPPPPSGDGTGTTVVALGLPVPLAAKAAPMAAAKKREKKAEATAALRSSSSSSPSSSRARKQSPCVPPSDARPVAELLTAALEGWERRKRGRRGRQEGGDGDGDDDGDGSRGEWKRPPSSSSNVVSPSSFEGYVPSSSLDDDGGVGGRGGVTERLAARLRALQQQEEEAAAATRGGEGEGARQQQRPPLPPPPPPPPPPPSRLSRSIEQLLAAWPD